jgi:hypothetical protein
MCIVQQYQLAAGVPPCIYNYKSTAVLFPINGNFVDFDVVSFSVVDPNWFQCGSGHSSFGPPGSGTGFVFPNADPDSADQNEYKSVRI